MRVVRPRRGARVYVPGDTTFRAGTTDKLSKRRTRLIRLLERRAPSDATVLLAAAVVLRPCDARSPGKACGRGARAEARGGAPAGSSVDQQEAGMRSRWR